MQPAPEKFENYNTTPDTAAKNTIAESPLDMIMTRKKTSTKSKYLHFLYSFTQLYGRKSTPYLHRPRIHPSCEVAQSPEWISLFEEGDKVVI